MSNVTCTGTVSPESLGFTTAEISQLAMIDMDDKYGDNDGIATADEFDHYRRTTMRTPAQMLPREDWVLDQLRLMEGQGKCGVSLRVR
ncbi:MAG: hypothetical protein R3C68_19750 [Myxococcota bacterium]